MTIQRDRRWHSTHTTTSIVHCRYSTCTQTHTSRQLAIYTARAHDETTTSLRTLVLTTSRVSSSCTFLVAPPRCTRLSSAHSSHINQLLGASRGCRCVLQRRCRVHPVVARRRSIVVAHSTRAQIPRTRSTFTRADRRRRQAASQRQRRRR